MADTGERNPLRTGIFGIAIVICVVLVAFGFQTLPFLKQGSAYAAYFADAGGTTPGNAVNISGIKVGDVTGVHLPVDKANVTFPVALTELVGDQYLACSTPDM